MYLIIVGERDIVNPSKCLYSMAIAEGSTNLNLMYYSEKYLYSYVNDILYNLSIVFDLFLQPSSYTRWNWRLLGSLYLSLSFNEDDYAENEFQNSNYTTAYAVNKRNVPVSMEAKLMASYEKNFDAEPEMVEWERLSEIKANRKLQCTVTSLQSGMMMIHLVF